MTESFGVSGLLADTTPGSTVAQTGRRRNRNACPEEQELISAIPERAVTGTGSRFKKVLHGHGPTEEDKATEEVRGHENHLLHDLTC